MAPPELPDWGSLDRVYQTRTSSIECRAGVDKDITLIRAETKIGFDQIDRRLCKIEDMLGKIDSDIGEWMLATILTKVYRKHKMKIIGGIVSLIVMVISSVITVLRLG